MSENFVVFTISLIIAFCICFFGSLHYDNLKLKMGYHKQLISGTSRVEWIKNDTTKIYLHDTVVILK